VGNADDQRAEMARAILYSGKNRNAISAPLHRVVCIQCLNDDIKVYTFPFKFSTTIWESASSNFAS
jgi:hypothetical protein